MMMRGKNLQRNSCTKEVSAIANLSYSKRTLLLWHTSTRDLEHSIQPHNIAISDHKATAVDTKMPIQIHQAKGFSKIDNDYIKELPTDNFQKEMKYETLPSTIEDLLTESDYKLRIEPDIDSIYGTASTLTAILDSMSNLQSVSFNRKNFVFPTGKTKIAVEFQHGQGTANEGSTYRVNLGTMQSMEFAKATNNGQKFHITAIIVDTRMAIPQGCSMKKEYSSVVFLAMNLTRLFLLNAITIEEIIDCYDGDNLTLDQIKVHLDTIDKAKAHHDNTGKSCGWLANGVIFGNFKKSLHIRAYLMCNTDLEAIAFSQVFDCFIQIMKLGVFQKKEFLRKKKTQLFTQDEFLQLDSSILRDQNTSLQTHMEYVGERLIFHVSNAGMKLKVCPIEVEPSDKDHTDSDGAEDHDNDASFSGNRVDIKFENNRQLLSGLLNEFVHAQAFKNHQSLSMFVDNGYEFRFNEPFKYCVVAPLGRPKKSAATKHNNTNAPETKSDDSIESDDKSSRSTSSSNGNDNVTVEESDDGDDDGDWVTLEGSDNEDVDGDYNIDVPAESTKLFPGPNAQYNLCNHPLLASKSSGTIPCKWNPELKKLSPVRKYNAVAGMQQYVSGMREAALYYRSELGPLQKLPAILRNFFTFDLKPEDNKELNSCMDILKSITEFRSIMDLGNEGSLPLRIELYYHIEVETITNEDPEVDPCIALSEDVFNVTRIALFSVQVAIAPKMPLVYCWYQSLEKARQLILRNIICAHTVAYTNDVYAVNPHLSLELQASLIFAGELLANGPGVRQGYNPPLVIMALIQKTISRTSPLLFPEHGIEGVTVNFKNEVVDHGREPEAPSSPIRFGISASYIAIPGQSMELISDLIDMEEISNDESHLGGCPWIYSIGIISKQLRAQTRGGRYQLYSKKILRKIFKTGLEFTLHAIKLQAQSYFQNEHRDVQSRDKSIGNGSTKKDEEEEEDKYLSRIITSFARVYLVAYLHQVKWDMMDRFRKLKLPKDQYTYLFPGPDNLPKVYNTRDMGESHLFLDKGEVKADCGSQLDRTPKTYDSWAACVHRDIYLRIKGILAALKVEAGEQYLWYFEETYFHGKICMEYLSICPRNKQLIAYSSSLSKRVVTNKEQLTYFRRMKKEDLLTAAINATQSKASMQSSQRTNGRQLEKLKVNVSNAQLQMSPLGIKNLLKIKWMIFDSPKSLKKMICFNVRQWAILVIHFKSLTCQSGDMLTFEVLSKNMSKPSGRILYALYAGELTSWEVSQQLGSKLKSILCLATTDIISNVLESEMVKLFNHREMFSNSCKFMGIKLRNLLELDPDVGASILSSLHAFRIVEPEEEQLTNSNHDKFWIKGRTLAFIDKFVSNIPFDTELKCKELEGIAQVTLAEIMSEMTYNAETQQSQDVPGAAQQTTFDSDADERFEVMNMDTQQSQDVPGAAQQTTFDSDADERFEVMNMDTQQSQDGLDVDPDIEHDTGEERVDADKFIVQDFLATQKWCNVAMSTTFSISAESPKTSLDPDPKDDDTVLYAMKMLQIKLDSIIGKAESAHENDLAWLTSIGSTLGAQNTRITDDDLDPNVTMELACKTFEGFINKIDEGDQEIQQRKKRQKH